MFALEQFDTYNNVCFFAHNSTAQDEISEACNIQLRNFSQIQKEPEKALSESKREYIEYTREVDTHATYDHEVQCMLS